uniref:BamA/TamA family outer membrane protein n=1 Tax=uncultured Draconibacterium sp. TaxID=1573823 RepID=UPI003216F2EC
MINAKLQYLLLFLAVSISCFIFTQAKAQNAINTSLFLAGNTAANNTKENDAFIRELTNLDQPYAFISLGNYSSAYTENNKLNIIVFPNSIENKQVPLLFTMGPNEWQTGKKHTQKVIQALHDKFPDNHVYTTDWGCPGPTEVEINEKLTVILIDTYWWLTHMDTRYAKCGIEADKDVFIWLQDALRRNTNKTVVVAGYHPIKSFGTHGGSFPAAVNILGFPYAAYKNLIGDKNDLSHPEYKNLRKQLLTILNQFPNVIYASSLENSMQYIQHRNIHQIISGSLQNQAYVNTSKPDFGSNEAGIARLDIYENGDVVLHFFSKKHGTKKPVFSKKLFTKKTVTEASVLAGREKLFEHPTHITYASRQYLATDRYKKWMGENYRKVWATPIEARVFDISKEHGGLTILKRGGGQQTKSLRLEDKDGKQYVLRSLEKYAEGAIPEEMKHTFAKDIVQDQISASNPYSALPAAVLAEHAGAYHTNPEIVYVPQDPLFKHYKEDMHSGLFLYEERPAKDRSELKSFGFSKDIVNTEEVILNTTESEDYQVDQHAVLRARLLDIFINDWDRHDDQWRWASFKNNGKTIYRPIPRDRDQTFFVNQGILPGIAALPFAMPKIQNFQPRTKYVIGLGFNARYFDRTFLTQMEWQDWENATNDLLQRMTPKAIQEAMATFPKEVKPMLADSTARILLERKKYMNEMARELYLYLSKRVNITGTDRRDLFEIERSSDDETHVTVHHIKKDGTRGKQIFKRTFKTRETREIVCYGLDKEDRFEIWGEVNKGPVVRIVGGQDKDRIVDNSKVSGLRNKNIVYDLKKSTAIEGGKETRKLLSNNKIIHEYNRKYFKRDVGMPLATGGYNADDGIYMGYGRSWYFQRFRRDIKASVLGDYAFKNSAFNINTRFQSLSTNNGFDYILGFDVSGPNYTTNFYGFGNNTTNKYLDYNYKYFNTKQRRLIAGLTIQKRFGKSVWARYDDDEIRKSHPVNEHSIGVNIKWRLTDTQGLRNKFITNFDKNGLSAANLGQKQYAIAGLNYQYQNLNKDFIPTRGYTINTSADRYINLTGNEPDFTKIAGSLASLVSFGKYPRTVFAFRVGGEKVIGDYYFHDAAVLDGKTNLRGFRQTRFYGNESLYLNSEARIKLYDFRNYLLTGEIGLLLFDDVGRVWFDNENSNSWHNGYGAGIWLSPFKMAIITATLNKSTEETLVQFKFSYLF